MLHPIMKQIFKDFNKVFPVTEERYAKSISSSISRDETQDGSQVSKQEQVEDCKSS